MDFKNKKFKKFTVSRTPPKNLQNEDIFLFETELKRTFKSPKVFIKKNIYIDNSKLKKYKYFRSYSNHWRMSNFWLKHKIKFFIEDFLLFIANLRNAKKDIKVIEKASWVLDQKSWKYMHFYSDALQRIELISNYLDEYPIVISSNYSNYKYTVDTLDILKIPYIVINKDKLYRVKELLISSHVAPAGNYNVEIINSISGKIKEASNIQENILNKKYWISRKNASIRNVLNSNDVDHLLRRYNYEVLYLEDLDTQEQISTLSKAKVIAGLQGAGLNNILFMHPDTNVLEIRDRKDNKNNCYFSLASALNINFYYSHADTVEPGNFHSSDYIIDIKSLEKAFENIENNLLLQD